MKPKVFSAILMVLALAMAVTAQTKITGTCTCSKPEKQYSIRVGDRANHSFMISQLKCTWSQPLELEGVRSKEGVSTAFDEVTGSSSRTRGFYLNTLANGDKCHVRYQGTATVEAGLFQNAEGTWSYIGGTGNFRGLKGKGTYKGTGNADGSVTYQIEGEYQLPKK